MVEFLKGKKTYLVAGVIALLTVVLVALHRLTPEVGCILILLGGSALGATFRSALASHQKEVIAILADAAIAGGAVAARQIPVALDAGKAAVAGTSDLVKEVEAETAPQGASQ